MKKEILNKQAINELGLSNLNSANYLISFCNQIAEVSIKPEIKFTQNELDQIASAGSVANRLADLYSASHYTLSTKELLALAGVIGKLKVNGQWLLQLIGLALLLP